MEKWVVDYLGIPIQSVAFMRLIDMLKHIKANSDIVDHELEFIIKLFDLAKTDFYSNNDEID